MLGRPDGFMNGKLGVDFFSTSELLYSNMKYRRTTNESLNYFLLD